MARLLAILLLGAVTAQADDAKSHYKQGTTYYALGKYPEAAIEYEKAYELHPDPALLYNSAQAHRMAGNKPRAHLLYSNYLRLYPNAPKIAEVQRFVTQLKAAIDSEKSATTIPPTAPEPLKTEPPAVSVEKPVEKRPIKPWVWGVIGGAAAVVVGVSLGVGLGIGLSKTENPTPTLGGIQW